MPNLGSLFSCFKKVAGDAAEQYGGANARNLVEEGFDQINVAENQAGAGGGFDVGGLMQAFTGKQQGGLSNLLSLLSGGTGALEKKAGDQGMDPALIQAVTGMFNQSGGGGGGGFNMGMIMQIVQGLTKGGGAGGFMSLLSGGAGGGGGAGGSNSNQIIQILIGLAKSFFAMQMGKNKSVQDWGDAGANKNRNDDNVGKWADNVIGDLVFPGKKQKDIVNDDDDPKGKDTNPDDVKGWYDGHPEIGKMQKDVFDDIFDTTDDDDEDRKNDDAPLIPAPIGFKQDCSILDHTCILFLNSKILLELRKTWRYLYSTETENKSFGDMVSAIKYQGPTLIIVKTQSGSILGAFASTSWAETDGGWIGNGDSFVFSLEPKMAVFYSTGKNENFMYLDNENGLGLGGKPGHFGFGILPDLSGLSYNEEVDTFDLPVLKGGASYNIDHVEVWGLGPEVDPSEERSKVNVRKPNLQIKGGGVDMNDLMSQMM